MKTVREFTQPVSDAARQTYLAGLGVVSVMDTRARKTFGELVEKGRGVNGEWTETTRSRVATAKQSIGKRVNATGDALEDLVRKNAQRVMNRLGVPGREEIQELTRSVEALTKKVNSLKLDA